MGITAPLRGSDERQPLIRRRSFDAYDPNADDVPAAARVAGGTILGVHNLAIVAPQFIVCVFHHSSVLSNLRSHRSHWRQVSSSRLSTALLTLTPKTRTPISVRTVWLGSCALEAYAHCSVHSSPARCLLHLRKEL